MMRRLLSFIFLSFLQKYVNGFYVPGVSPNSWKEGEEILLNVNKMTSVKTLVPYEYYYLPFCRPKHKNELHENLGEIMAGDMLENSLYHITMLQNQRCEILCRPMTYTPKQTELFMEYIRNEYYVHWAVDNLPVLYRQAPELEIPPIRGYPIGGTDVYGEYYLYNHLILRIKITKDEEDEDKNEDKWQIVGFEVEPVSIRHQYNEAKLAEGEELISPTCNSTMDISEYASVYMNEENIAINRQYAHYQYLDPKNDTTVLFTYDVEFIESDISWDHRWDEIIASKNSNDQIHWFSIINSLVIVLFLTGMVAMIMLRALHRDITKYNEIQMTEDGDDENGWKLVHGDVFRPPQDYPMLFCVSVGTGVQLAMMTMLTMLIALLGLLSPANRGSLLTTLLLLYVFMGALAGYYSARTYKMFNGKNWKRNTLLTALYYPGVVFSIFFMLNLLLWINQSSLAVPFGTFFALLLLWFGISVPLVYFGSYFGYKQAAITPPVRVNQIARQIPTQPWYLSAWFSILVGGILPFGAVFIELYFIMSALWLHQIYYVFGFLFLVLLILAVTCAEVTVVLCYFQLCSEDYQWWWRSFLTSGSAAIYLYLYSVVYFFAKLDVTAFLSGCIYFGYMAIISMTFFLVTGTIGYFSCLWFTRSIYASIKTD